MNTKTHGDTRNPFLVKQIQTLTEERNKERKIKEKYANEINEVATYLGCYGHSKAIISKIEKHKRSHEDFDALNIEHPFRFAVLRLYNYLIRRFAW